MKDFYINHLHFQVGNGRGEFSTLITKEAVEEYSLANFGELPKSHADRNTAMGIMAVKTIKYATNNNWRKMHGLKMLKRKIRRN